MMSANLRPVYKYDQKQATYAANDYLAYAVAWPSAAVSRREAIVCPPPAAGGNHAGSATSKCYGCWQLRNLNYSCVTGEYHCVPWRAWWLQALRRAFCRGASSRASGENHHLQSIGLNTWRNGNGGCGRSGGGIGWRSWHQWPETRPQASSAMQAAWRRGSKIALDSHGGGKTENVAAAS